MDKRKNLPSWLNRQTFAQIILVIIFIGVCAWIAFQPNPFDEQTPPPPHLVSPQAPPNATEKMLQETAMRLEIEANRDQTLGIVLGGSLLVVLIVGGTLLVINRQ
jgi:hypothetical protein